MSAGDEKFFTPLFFQKFREFFLDFWKLPHLGYHGFASEFCKRRRIKIGLCIVNTEYKGRLAFTCQNITHEQGACSMITLVKELRLTYEVDVNRRRLFPGGFITPFIVNRDHLADIAFFLTIKTVGCGGNMLMKFFSCFEITSTEDNMIEFQYMMQAPAMEQVDIFSEQPVDIGVTEQHILDNYVFERVPSYMELFIDTFEIALNLTQRTLYFR